MAMTQHILALPVTNNGLCIKEPLDTVKTGTAEAPVAAVIVMRNWPMALKVMVLKPVSIFIPESGLTELP
jgi:hypothetical protein